MAYETEHSLINGASNNTTASANSLSSGVWMIASLASSTDVDYFKINPTSAGLIKIDFANDLLTTTNHWKIALLNSNGDYVTTLTSSVSGTPVVSGDNTGTTLVVSGLTSAVPAGSRFTFGTTSADTTIYTVVSATTPSAGQSTLTLDTTLPSGLLADTTLVFDPAQTLADGGATSLTAQVSAAGSYYLAVSAGTWSDAEYQLRATIQPTIEHAGDNNTKEEAVASDNRLIENAWMTGALSASTSGDVWVFSTAAASDFTIDFTAATGDDNAPAWKINVAQWSGQPLTTVSGTDISNKTAGASTSFAVDDAKYTTATTFVVTVEAASTAAFSAADYKLRVSGTNLNLNDAPVITVDTVSSARPDDNIDTGVSRSIKAGADSKVALSSLFSVSDADAGQTIASYKAVLNKATGETGSVSGSIQLIESDGTTVSATYVMGSTITLTAAEMAKAYVLPGTVTGNLSLTVQAFDSSSAADNSGASSFMTQTLRVVSADVGVTVANDGTLSLVEADTNSSETLSVNLATAPTGNVLVYLEQGTPNQFTFSSSLLTFTTANYATAQTVTVRAKDDNTTEGSHSAQVSFRVVSADSQYDGYSLSPLTVALADPTNRAPSGEVTISGTVTEDQTLTATTTTLADADGLGTLNYQWQRSSDGSTAWADIASAASSTYTLGDSDVGKYVRVAVSYLDNAGTSESVPSSASAVVANVNDAPSTANVTVTTSEDTAYTFSSANFGFTDVDSGDSLKAVEIQGLPAKGTLKYDGSAIALTGGVYSVLAANIGNLTYTPAANGNGAAYTSFDFKVVDQSSGKSLAKTATINVTAVDDAYTGEVAINGTAVGGRTLTLANSLADADVLGTFSYKWQTSTDGSAWSDISGATAASYALTSAEVGLLVRAQVSYTDGGGTANSINTAATAAVSATNSAPTGSVSIDGTVTEDQTLTANTTTLSDADGLGTLSYLWQRSSDGSAWGNISAATASTYAAGDADVGKFLRVLAAYTDGAGVAESVASSATSAVANVNDVPVLAVALPNQTGVKATSFEYRFDAGSFTDADGESLTYTATLDSGASLPSWLTFNGSTRTFSGTPGTTDTGTIDIKVTAKDASNASATDVFALTVADAASTGASTLSGKAYFWNKVAAQGTNSAGHVLMDGVTVSANDGGTAREGTTAAGGAYSCAGIVATTAAVTASQTYTTADKATVTLGDALEVLKLYLGKLASPSPYKYLASDFNADNKVSLTDALAILKSVLNKAGALEPAWVFVDEEANVSGLTTLSATRPTVDAHPVGTDPSLNLVAVLRGDANGSWKPAATASYEVLPDTYFTDPTTGLVGLHPDYITTGQFGI